MLHVKDWMQGFTTLKCGSNYWVVVEAGEGEVNIFDLTIADEQDVC